jgi:hypothetical protein
MLALLKFIGSIHAFYGKVISWLPASSCEYRKHTTNQ